VTETYTTTDANGQSQTRTRQVQKIRWSRAAGTVARDFDDLLVRGTSRVHAKKLDKLEIALTVLAVVAAIVAVVLALKLGH
jgi:hypothetical protein